MQIAEETIDLAFEAHGQVYSDWQVDETMRLCGARDS